MQASGLTFPVRRVRGSASGLSWPFCASFGLQRRGGTRLCTIGTAQAQTVQLEDALEMGEQHFDLFSLAP